MKRAKPTSRMRKIPTRANRAYSPSFLPKRVILTSVPGATIEGRGDRTLHSSIPSTRDPRTRETPERPQLRDPECLTSRPTSVTFLRTNHPPRLIGRSASKGEPNGFQTRRDSAFVRPGVFHGGCGVGAGRGPP